VRKKYYATIGAIGISAVLALTGCSGGSNAAQSLSSHPKGAGKTLTVWAMTGDYTAPTLAAVNAEFTKQTGAKVKIETQQWLDITTKVTTALATSTPPDVLDLGNTQVSGFAATGGLLDLTPYKKSLQQGSTWLSGLADPATIGGKLYAVPAFAGDRAVIYNKKMWAAAGITEAPKTYSELTADLDKIKAAHTAPNFSAFYLPGQYWYAGLQFVLDAGGSIAKQSGGQWKGQFSSSADQQGLKDFKTFQNAYSSPATQNIDQDKPDQLQVFAAGDAATVLDTSGAIATILKDNPSLTNADLGTFAFPGKSGKLQPVMLGGSDWGIAAKSQNKDLALAWTKIAGSPEFQNKYVFGKDGWIPNSTEGIAAAKASGLSPQQTGYFDAAKNSFATPAAPNWSSIEGDRSVNQFFGAVVSGAQTPSAAAKDFDAHMESALNGH
jgi:N,N'-diacetylchitobiose transport system substrate-binding protein